MFVFVCCEVATVGEPVESDHRAELLLGLQLKRTFRKAADAVGHWAYTSFDSVFCAAVAPMYFDFLCSAFFLTGCNVHCQHYSYGRVVNYACIPSTPMTLQGPVAPSSGDVRLCCFEPEVLGPLY